MRLLDPEHASGHLDRLYRAAWALSGSRDDAEDLVQETYARVLARPRFLRNDDDFGYLLRALRNTFLARLRAERRRPRTEPLREETEPAAGVTPEDRLDARHLFATIAKLSPDFRDVLVAVDVAGLSYREAADSLRIAEGTVMSRLYRARQQVVRSLPELASERHGAAASPGGELQQRSARDATAGQHTRPATA
jgi:RNA polymerase sigma-70 factor, ECF subfamily